MFGVNRQASGIINNGDTEEVLRNNNDLVIKTARGMGGRIGMLFGSTAMHLLRKCPCPVWLIKPEQGPHFCRIITVVDVVSPEVEKNNLNNKIMTLATSLVLAEKSELHIVHAWEKPDGIFWTGELNFLPSDIRTLIYEAKDMHIRWLNNFLEQYDLRDLQHHEHVLQGRSDEVIAGFAEEHQMDLIVMGTVCRTGIPGFFIGNRAEKILHMKNCSVLAVKPGDFVTLVQLDEK